MKSKIKVVIIQRVCTHYRVALLNYLSQINNLEIILYYGESRISKNSRLQNIEEIKEIQSKKLFTLYWRIHIRQKVFDIFFNPSIIFHLFKDKPDVIICEGESNLPNNIFIVLYSKITKTPYIWWGLGRVRSNKPSILRKIFYPLIKYMLENAGAILAYSTFAKDFYSSYGIERNKIFTAYNCIDTNKAKQDIKKYTPLLEGQKLKLGLNNKKIILFVGSFIKEKKIDNLILAYKKVKQQISDVALLLVGDGEIRKKIEDLVKEEQLIDVIFAGQHIEDVSLYFLMGDIFVLPGEGGLAINQAMVHGLPIITVPADGTELDMVIEGQNGYLVSNSNVDALADTIVRLLKKEERDIKQMGQKSRELVDTKFNIENMTKIFMDSIIFSLNKKIC
jgi:glycosyltransferase involved in cell wall biosynthesis